MIAPTTKLNYFTCHNATCVTDGNNTFTITIGCLPPADIDCPKGYIQKSTFNQDTCCNINECQPEFTPTYCTGPDGSQKKIGDTWISNCYECICSKNYQVTCNEVKCVTYPAPFCNEEGFEIVKFVTKEDPCCPKHECRCNPSLCQKKTTVCQVGFELTVNFGVCCISLSCVAKGVCVQNNVEYPPTLITPSHLGPCFECTCSTRRNPITQLNEIECVDKQCQPCPLGHYRSPAADVCCSQCVAIGCIKDKKYGGQNVYKDGDSWREPDEQCMSYKCNQVNGQFIVTVEKQICPAFYPEDCENGTIEDSKTTCCPTCKVISKPCTLATVTVPIEDGLCTGVAEIGICKGTCFSSVQYTPGLLKPVRKCACCTENTMTKKSTILNCPGGKQKLYEYISIASCACIDASCVN
ncbi:intestinal mucin-like protein [Ambystoma mexicanum]|uniref:intestinal mucin-like protein n=1 Tax=Ambystoma mexicanum TaxID=8296 RepID=UPI0037E71893